MWTVAERQKFHATSVAYWPKIFGVSEDDQVLQLRAWLGALEPYPHGAVLRVAAALYTSREAGWPPKPREFLRELCRDGAASEDTCFRVWLARYIGHPLETPTGTVRIVEQGLRLADESIYLYSDQTAASRGRMKAEIKRQLSHVQAQGDSIDAEG